MTLYGIKTCDTCRRAMKALKQVGHDVTFVDIRQTPLDDATRADFLNTFGEHLINTRSTTWRGMDEAARALPRETQLADHPSLMKRPVIEADRLYLGWGTDVQEALL